MECAHVAHAEHWWDHDYAQISQFYGRWFLHGFGRGHVTNVLFIISNVRILLFISYLSGERKMGLSCLMVWSLRFKHRSEKPYLILIRSTTFSSLCLARSTILYPNPLYTTTTQYTTAVQIHWIWKRSIRTGKVLQGRIRHEFAMFDPIHITWILCRHFGSSPIGNPRQTTHVRRPRRGGCGHQ